MGLIKREDGVFTNLLQVPDELVLVRSQDIEVHFKELYRVPNRVEFNFNALSQRQRLDYWGCRSIGSLENVPKVRS
jgi:hypothetical protein